MDGGSGTVEIIQPEESLAIPSGYREPCEQAGCLERLNYDTFEAFSYADRSESLSKYAIVYVSYGYDEERKVQRGLSHAWRLVRSDHVSRHA